MIGRHPDNYVGAVCGNRRCVGPGHLLVGTLKKCHALRGRGPSPLGPGDVWSIRQYLCDGVATAEQLAEAYSLRPEFIAAVAGTR